MLSKRLKTIASLVKTKSVIDVGCDHALLCIYLTNKGINCRGTDISENVLKGAYENLKKYNLDGKIDLIQTDGLENIKIKQDDTIIIAGMGTSTILNILKDYDYNNPLIISSNNDLYKLRKEIIKKGYYIKNEEVVFEKKHYYVIIEFDKGNKKYSHYDYLFGPYSSDNIKYMIYLLDKYQKILNNLPKKYIFKQMEIRRYILKLKFIIKKLNN